jgi:hypothetical protein
MSFIGDKRFGEGMNLKYFIVMVFKAKPSVRWGRKE